LDRLNNGVGRQGSVRSSFPPREWLVAIPSRQEMLPKSCGRVHDR
jgi:hypothetical protein